MGSLIRTPQHTCLAKADGSLKCLRDGDKKWSKDKVRQEMPAWSSLDAFLSETKPSWWMVTFKYPSGWFAVAHKAHYERLKALPSPDGTGTYTLESQKIWDETFGGRRKEFLYHSVLPFTSHYGLVRAADHDKDQLLFGSAGSPAARMAEEQMLEIEPDRTKWTQRAWAPGGHHFSDLYYRNQAYQSRKATEALKQRAAAPAVPPLLVPPAAAPTPAPLPAPRKAYPELPANQTIITRDKLDFLLATGIKKVPDELWATLTDFS